MPVKTTQPALAIALLLTATAPAVADATISDISGKVLSNEGLGYRAASPGAVLKTGTRILVYRKSGAVLTYANGCKVTLSPGVATVPQMPRNCLRGSLSGAAGAGIFSSGALLGSGGGMASVVGFGTIAAIGVTINSSQRASVRPTYASP